MRPADRRPARDDGRGAAVIADRDAFVVRQERIVGPHHRSDVGGVMDRRVEIGVVADRDRHPHRRPPHRHEARLDLRAQVPLIGMIGVQQLAEPRPQRRPDRPAERHQRVQRPPPCTHPPCRGPAVEQPAGVTRSHVEDLAADRDADARSVVVMLDERAERQILQWKVGVGCVRGGHPAPDVGIVRLVQHSNIHKSPAGAGPRWARRGT